MKGEKFIGIGDNVIAYVIDERRETFGTRQIALNTHLFRAKKWIIRTV